MKQEKEAPDVVVEIWSKLRMRVKLIIYALKAELRKETEESLLFEGLKKLLLQIAGQNTDSMNVMVASLKESFPKVYPSVPVSSSSSNTESITTEN